MAENKRIYWLRLREDFFEQPKIRKLRRLPGGDGYLVIYLRIQQLTVQTGGILTRKGTEQDLADELALELDEDGTGPKPKMSAYYCGIVKGKH